jgi:hypothetical protein
MTGVEPAALGKPSAVISAESRLSKSASILFRMATDESSEFQLARFGMGLAYSFSSTAPAPAGGLVNEEKSA